MKRTYVLRGLFGFVITLSVASQPALSQQPPAGGAAKAGGAGGLGRTTSPTPRDNNPNMDTLNRPTYLSGKVQMDDGTAPPEPVVIERVCNGSPRAEGYTDSKGRFSFQLGENRGVIQDASYDDMGNSGIQPNAPARRNTAPMGRVPTGGGQRSNAGQGGQGLTGCELRASLAGFRSDMVNLSGRRMFDHPDVGTIILHRLANVEGTTISMTTLQAPKDARKAYDKAREALRKEKTADAQKELEKAVSAYPQFAAAWYELGLIHEKANDPAEARKYYAQAIASDGKLVTPYLHLAQLAVRERKWQEAVDTSGRVIKLDAVDFPDAYLYNAVANYNLQRFDAAEASARQAQKLDTAHRWPKADRVLGAILYEKKDFTGAAEQLRNYLTFAPDAADAGQVKAQLAELEKLSGDAKAKAEKPDQ